VAGGKDAARMSATAVSQIAPDSLVLRRVQFSAACDGSPGAIASEHGCEVTAIAQLMPFVIDDSFITVLASAARLVRSAELLVALRGAVVRRPRTHEILLGVQLGRTRHTVYMDEALLEHQELLFCVDPPRGYAAAGPEALRRELSARLISLPAVSSPTG
jgi:hypothetical protein